MACRPYAGNCWARTEVGLRLPLSGRDEALAALREGKPALVWRKVVADTLTPVAAAVALMEEGRGDFLLESVEGGETRGRYSLLGLDPDLVFRSDCTQASVNRRWQQDRGSFEKHERPTLDALRALLDECRAEVSGELPNALACLVGYFGYETIGLVEKIPSAGEAPLDLPDMLFVRPTLILIIDNLTDALFAIAPIWSGNRLEPELTIAAAADRIDVGLARLRNWSNKPLSPSRDDLDDPVPRSAVEPEAFESMVCQAKEYIAAGDIFQVVLSQRFTAPFCLPPMALYRALRRINPSPFLFFLDLPGFAIVGSSPEILVRVRDDTVTIRPIAGTRPRGSDAEKDLAAERSLLADEKERAEHLMLLDLGRNDVGRVAAPGTVEVTQSFSVERYSHVMHIVSQVTGRLDPAHDALEALFAGFPAGTVSGAPKVRACQIIAELEPAKRGPYAGGVGYFAPDGSLDSCIVLRTAIVKDGEMHVQAGAGIVADSDPTYEQRECEAKAGALFAAAREAVRQARDTDFGQ